METDLISSTTITQLLSKINQAMDIILTNSINNPTNFSKEEVRYYLETYNTLYNSYIVLTKGKIVDDIQSSANDIIYKLGKTYEDYKSKIEGLSIINQGYKNILINGDMRVNQRGFGGVWSSLSDGSYGYDRWKKNGANIVQIIESINYKPNTVYTLSGTGVTTQQLTSPASGTWTITVPNTATNIQLEEGSVATLYEKRSYGLELMLCQRYLVDIGNAYMYGVIGDGTAVSTTEAQITIPLPVHMRARPIISNTLTASSFQLETKPYSTQTCTSIAEQGFETSSEKTLYIRVGVSSGLTAGYGVTFGNKNTTTNKILLSAEL